MGSELSCPELQKTTAIFKIEAVDAATTHTG
jgi:hypothetical protein